MADVFERRAELNEWRERLWSLIEETPMLDWLILTKRPQNIAKMTPWEREWPENIWLGTTVENQKFADLRLPHLLKHQAKVRFLSCEPLLGEIDLRKWIKPMPRKKLYGIDWVIAGGESGPKSRPMDASSLRFLRDTCLENQVPFHFKQWGNWGPAPKNCTRKMLVVGEVQMANLGKAVAGRVLDGKKWDQLPV